MSERHYRGERNSPEKRRNEGHKDREHIRHEEGSLLRMGRKLTWWFTSLIMYALFLIFLYYFPIPF